MKNSQGIEVTIIKNNDGTVKIKPVNPEYRDAMILRLEVSEYFDETTELDIDGNNLAHLLRNIAPQAKLLLNSIGTSRILMTFNFYCNLALRQIAQMERLS